ncbi:50S ribosomal protein L31e [Candidatus Woesearchaeota archaeon]|nr:50S ribosomal protein L31e [Candidatus Woesearchaeota archaeon]
MAEQTYNIPLRKEFLKKPKYRRAKKAVTAVRQFMTKHAKSDKIIIGPYLNKKIWEHGMKNPPSKVSVTAIKDDKGFVKVELFGAPKEIKVEDKKKAKKEAKPAAKTEAAPAAKEVKPAAPAKPAPAKEAPAAKPKPATEKPFAPKQAEKKATPIKKEAPAPQKPAAKLAAEKKA